jgi:hypothetical protein
MLQVSVTKKIKTLVVYNLNKCYAIRIGHACSSIKFVEGKFCHPLCSYPAQGNIGRALQPIVFIPGSNI